MFDGYKYPWDRWTDQRVWMVEQGRDFDCRGYSLMGQAHNIAQKTPTLKVTGSVFAFADAADIVIFRFYDKDSEWKPNMTAIPVWRNLMDELGRTYR